MIRIHYHEGGYYVTDEEGVLIDADVEVRGGKVTLIIRDYEILLKNDTITKENPGG